MPVRPAPSLSSTLAMPMSVNAEPTARGGPGAVRRTRSGFAAGAAVRGGRAGAS